MKIGLVPHLTLPNVLILLFLDLRILIHAKMLFKYPLYMLVYLTYKCCFLGVHM